MTMPSDKRSRPNVYPPICDCGNPKQRRSRICRSCRNAQQRELRRKADSEAFIHNGEPCRWIPLTKGKRAICSECDYAELSQHNWFAVWSPAHKSYFAERHVANNCRNKRSMHEYVCPSDKKLNHRNRDLLDNSRNNLRPATQSQILHAAPKGTRNTTGYKGVTKKISGPGRGKWYGKWTARIMCNGKSYGLGVFDEPYEASLAYQRKAIELMGEFVNFD